jgi:hypothetical protein
VKKQQIDKQTQAETWMLSNKQREINTWQDDISYDIDVSMEFDASFNFPKIPLIFHCVK